MSAAPCGSDAVEVNVTVWFTRAGFGALVNEATGVAAELTVTTS